MKHDDHICKEVEIAFGPGGNDQTWKGAAGGRYHLLQFVHQLQRSFGSWRDKGQPVCCDNVGDGTLSCSPANREARGIVFVANFSRLQLHGQTSAGPLQQHRQRYRSRSPAVWWSHRHCARGKLSGWHLSLSTSSTSGSVDLCRLRLVGVLALWCRVSSRRNVRSNKSTGKLSMCQRSRFSKRTPAGTCATIVALQTALAHLAVKSNS